VSPSSYESPLREQRAAETRLRIREAARGLFEELGFAAATVNEIAKRAGVSAATVYSVFGSKAGIVVAMLEDLEEGAEVRAKLQEMFEETDPHRGVLLFAATNRMIFELGHTILRAAYDARGIPEVRTLAESGDANRRRGCEAMVTKFAAAGGLRDGLSPEEAVLTMWLLTSVEQYLLATEDLGMSGRTYERWLTSLLRRELLGAEG
jgi:AcrR family transcriptional regulator